MLILSNSSIGRNAEDTTNMESNDLFSETSVPILEEALITFSPYENNCQGSSCW